MGEGKRRHPWIAALAGGALLPIGGYVALWGFFRSADFDSELFFSKGDPSYWPVFWLGVGIIAVIPIVVAFASGHGRWLRRGLLGLAVQVVAGFLAAAILVVVPNVLAPAALGFVVGGAVALRPPPARVLPSRIVAVLALVGLILVDQASNGIYGAAWSPLIVFVFGLFAIAFADAVAARAAAAKEGP